MATAQAGGDEHLQFAAYSSALDTGFWHQLTQLKLDVYQLDDKPKPITGYYFNGDAPGITCHVNLDYNAFQEDFKTPTRHFPCRGSVKNTNTLDDFKNLDKRALLDGLGSELWESIVSGRAIQDPSLLSRFLLITFADLKKYNYYYWFAFPALCAPEKVRVKGQAPIGKVFSEGQIAALLSAYEEQCLPSNTGFFLVGVKGDGVTVAQLRDFDTLKQQADKVLLCVCDPCTLDGHPGWPLRPLLTLAAYHWSSQLGECIQVVCLRDRFKDGQRSVEHSLVLDISLPSIADLKACPKCVGWEKNERGKMGPRLVNLGSSMDPTRLAESAVDLNLKLMRWRLLPSLDLEKISSTRCLLLGAGTLGCNVARSLLAWGVRTITFVDNGQISYSNPVRQSLFAFEDSLNGGQPKAQCAAQALKRIFPGVKTEGHMFSIPMPGHAVSGGAIEQVQNDVRRLEQLVDEHDVVFLLMDTRESRWLPTLMGAAKGKIVINAALGFDTFLVVRHGLKLSQDDVAMDTDDGGQGATSIPQVLHGSQLGCYFCNDVVAPGDSTRDRTLDQQCTVSRPGMSMITSALAVELLVSVLTHPHGGHAPADTSAKDEHLTKESDSPLGVVPHQIRGFLSRFHHVMPASQCFDKCTACSHTVIEHYRREGFEFLVNVFNKPSYLEDLTGLTQLHAETLEEEVWDFSDTEEI